MVGDAVIGINPASDSIPALMNLYYLVDDVISQYSIPTQSCILTHVTNQIQLIEKGAPVDLIFQSIAGTEKANKSFGINLDLLKSRAFAEPRQRRQKCDVFRNRPGHRAFRQRQFWRRSADLRGARLRHCQASFAVIDQHRGGLYRAGIFVRRQANHPGRPGRSLLRQTAGRAHGMRRVLHQPPEAYQDVWTP